MCSFFVDGSFIAENEFAKEKHGSSSETEGRLSKIMLKVFEWLNAEFFFERNKFRLEI